MNRLIKNAIITFFCIILFLTRGISSYSQNQPIKIGFVGIETKSELSGKEITAAFKLIQNNKDFAVKYISFSQIAKKAKLLDQFNVIWFHRPDTSNFSDIETDTKVILHLKNYLLNGGNLLVTLSAFNYLRDLGIELEKPQIRYANAIDDGYGRKLGIHSMRNHPIFNGLFGGAYIFSPKTDQTTRLIGYFDETVPQLGKVVGVNWSYIMIKESDKLVVEYSVGKGKVLAVGAYTWYSEPNFNALHLKLFTENCLNYLAGKLNGERQYWNYSRPDVYTFSTESEDFFIYPASGWRPSQNTFVLRSDSSTTNYYDAGGQRMLIMGKEKGGIDEIWIHPFMAFRDYEAGFRFSDKDSIWWLRNAASSIEVRPESFTRTYKFNGCTLKEIITTEVEKAVGVVHYEFKGSNKVKMFVKIKSNLRLMWPYSENVPGSIYYTWNETLNGLIVKDQNADFISMFGSNKRPSYKKLGRYGNIAMGDSGIITQTTDKNQLIGLFQFQLNKTDNIDFIIAGSSAGKEDVEKEYRLALRDPDLTLETSAEYFKNLVEQKLMITTPDKNFNEGYRWALAGTDRFFTNTPGVGKSLVAGFSTTARGWDGGHKVNGRPGYAWYFGRDSEWSAFALLDYGDFKKVRSVLEFLQNYQDLSGKIFHELTTSGVVHYDAADATPLYIILAGKYLLASGDVDFIRKSWPNIKKALDYLYTTDTDDDHLIENFNVGHGWVEGGNLYGAKTTLYLAGCWASALENAADITKSLNMVNESSAYLKESEIVKKIINTDFYNKSTDFFYDGKMNDGTFMAEPTIQVAVPIYLNTIDKDKIKPILRLYAENNFSSDWGTRIISEESQWFKPAGYHYGSVWPLFTGWTALAEYNNGRDIQGFTHIMNNLLIYKNWSLGYVEEVMNGADYQPSGVCPHQCWSETMVLQPVIEGMLGIQFDAINNKITISPELPANWDSLRVQNIRIGDELIDFTMNRYNGTIKYNFEKQKSTNLLIEFVSNTGLHHKNPGNINVIGGKEENGKIILTENKAQLIINYGNGIQVLPVISVPKPGKASQGLRIIDDQLINDDYKIDIQGPSGSRQILKIYSDFPNLQVVENARFLKQEKNIYELEVIFDKSKKKYLNKTIKIKVQ